MNDDRLLAIFSVIVGLVSLGFTIYKTEDTAIQVGFLLMIIIVAIAYFIIDNRYLLKNHKIQLSNLLNEVKAINSKINVHERLIKIEKEVVFKK